MGEPGTGGPMRCSKSSRQAVTCAAVSSLSSGKLSIVGQVTK